MMATPHTDRCSFGMGSPSSQGSCAPATQLSNSRVSSSRWGRLIQQHDRQPSVPERRRAHTGCPDKNTLLDFADEPRCREPRKNSLRGVEGHIYPDLQRLGREGYAWVLGDRINDTTNDRSTLSEVTAFRPFTHGLPRYFIRRSSADSAMPEFCSN